MLRFSRLQFYPVPAASLPPSDCKMSPVNTGFSRLGANNTGRWGAFPHVCPGGFSPNWSQGPLAGTRGRRRPARTPAGCKSQSRSECGGRRSGRAVPRLCRPLCPQQRRGLGRGPAPCGEIQAPAGRFRPRQVPARCWGAAPAPLPAEPGADPPGLPPHLQRAPVGDFDEVSERDRR